MCCRLYLMLVVCQERSMGCHWCCLCVRHVLRVKTVVAFVGYILCGLYLILCVRYKSSQLFLTGASGTHCSYTWYWLCIQYWLRTFLVYVSVSDNKLQTVPGSDTDHVSGTSCRLHLTLGVGYNLFTVLVCWSCMWSVGHRLYLKSHVCQIHASPGYTRGVCVRNVHAAPSYTRGLCVCMSGMCCERSSGTRWMWSWKKSPLQGRRWVTSMLLAGCPALTKSKRPTSTTGVCHMKIPPLSSFHYANFSTLCSLFAQLFFYLLCFVVVFHLSSSVR